MPAAAQWTNPFWFFGILNGIPGPCNLMQAQPGRILSLVLAVSITTSLRTFQTGNKSKKRSLTNPNYSHLSGSADESKMPVAMSTITYFSSNSRKSGKPIHPVFKMFKRRVDRANSGTLSSDFTFHCIQFHHLSLSHINQRHTTS